MHRKFSIGNWLPFGCCLPSRGLLGVAAVARLTVRLTDRMSAQLEAVAAERGVSCARFVRELIAGAVAGKRVEGLGPPAEDELLDLLAEKARGGNVAAIRSLLAREYVKDPRTRAVDLFAEMVAERQP